MKAVLRTVNDHGIIYDAIVFVCPGCVAGQPEGYFSEGIHMLPVNAPMLSKPAWDWDGNLEAPTLSPSILTKGGASGPDSICHSYLRNGAFLFLPDCTHPLADQTVPMVDLPDWAIDMAAE